MGDDRKRHGFDTLGWWIYFGVAGQLAVEAEVEFSRRLQTGVGETQCGQRLANGAKGTFHRARSHCSVTGRYCSQPITAGEKLE